MQSLKRITLALTAVALLCGTSSCSGNTEKQDKEEIVQLVNDFYGYAADEENSSKLASIAGKIPEGTSDEEGLKRLIEAAPEGFAFFDTSTLENGIEAYYLLGNNHAMLIIDGKNMRIEDDAVTLNKDGTAVVDQRKAYVMDIETGREERNSDVPEEAYDSYKTIKLTKVDGEWLMTPKETFGE